MKIDILTLFPEMYDGFLNTSIIKSAIDRKLVDIKTTNIRDYSLDKHKKVDDTPYGGGSGMVLACQPIFDAVKALKKDNSKVILMTPQGIKYNQKIAYNLSKEEHLILVCGHYEGFDERIRTLCDMELSIGDYVLTGGELPSMVIADSVVRLVDGVIEEGSHLNDSFNNDMLDYPTYTKPREYEGMKVPDVLLSGDHKKVDEWRKEESKKRTKERRPDLMKKFMLVRSTLKGNISIDKLKGYTLNPKNNAKRNDVITVKNLKIIEQSFSENVAKKNIDRRVQKLLILIMKVLDTDDSDDDVLVLDEADRIKSLLMNEYVKILGEDYRNSIIKKIDYVVREFNNKRRYVYEEVMEKSGKSR
ncbi:MAG: tRNA (guanosine(37)-N1)-methyltransferase TrmD [Bacilli bacterium]|nr:tRNA (guanosine(37)-N1)-methyltransferase TrmD [Bacilli bacterium]